jgi:hypothetical protein
MKLMITQEKDMLIIGGLIMKNKSVNMSGRKDSGVHLASGGVKREELNA